MTLSQRIAVGITDLGLGVHVDGGHVDGGHVDIADKLAHYLEMMVRWNRVTNLTAIKDLEEMVSLHLMDSLSVHSFVTGSRILDVGSGAGLPGIPLALLQPDKDFILLDSNGKKTRFMTQVAIELNLANVTVLQARIEDYTERFDQVISRAFSSLEEFVRVCMPRLNEGGSLLAMKGPSEIAQADRMPEASLHSLQVSGLNKERYLIVVPKLHGVKS